MIGPDLPDHIALNNFCKVILVAEASGLVVSNTSHRHAESRKV
jgi:hypothetical protein